MAEHFEQLAYQAVDLVNRKALAMGKYQKNIGKTPAASALRLTFVTKWRAANSRQLKAAAAGLFQHRVRLESLCGPASGEIR